MMHPQAGLDASVTWDLVRLDFHLTGWFEFIEMARHTGRNRALLAGNALLVTSMHNAPVKLQAVGNASCHSARQRKKCEPKEPSASAGGLLANYLISDAK